MRILLLTNLFPPDVLGGYELLARDVGRMLKARGHQMSVLTTGRGGPPALDRSLRLVRPFGETMGRERLRHLATTLHNRRATERHLAERGRPDAVLVLSQRRLGLEPVRVLQRHGVPLVFTVNDDWPVAYVPADGRTWKGRVRGVFERGLLASPTWTGLAAERVVYLSDAIRRHVLDAGAPLPEGRVQAQGVALELFQQRPFRPLGTPLRLLFVGRLHPSKSPETALDTVAALRARGLAAELTLAGGAVTPEYGKALRERAKALGIEAAVRWLGHVARESLPAIYAQSDAFLFPSAWEGEAMGLTYLEAMACGVPVVAFPAGGAREVLDRHPAAARASACTGEAFAEALVSLAASEERQRALVADGLRLVREHASLERYVDVLEAELQAAAGIVSIRDTSGADATQTVSS